MASNRSAVEVFSRDVVTGGLTPLPGPRGCYQDSTRAEQLQPLIRPVAACTYVPGIAGPSSVRVSPDDRFAYILGDAIVGFLRNGSDGSLTPLTGPSGCLGRSPGCGLLRGMPSLVVPYKIAVSADGDNAHVTFNGGTGLAVLGRDRLSGGIRQLPGAAGCLEQEAKGSCGRARVPFFSSAAPVIDPLGRAVYLGGHGLLVLRRHTR